MSIVKCHESHYVSVLDNPPNSCSCSQMTVSFSCMVCCACYHQSCTTIFYVAKSRCRFYFLQHENLLHKEVVIRPTNHLNLQRNIFARQVARKMLPVLLGLNGKCENRELLSY